MNFIQRNPSNSWGLNFSAEKFTIYTRRKEPETLEVCWLLIRAKISQMTNYINQFGQNLCHISDVDTVWTLRGLPSPSPTPLELFSWNFFFQVLYNLLLISLIRTLSREIWFSAWNIFALKKIKEAMREIRTQNIWLCKRKAYLL